MKTEREKAPGPGRRRPVFWPAVLLLLLAAFLLGGEFLDRWRQFAAQREQQKELESLYSSAESGASSSAASPGLPGGILPRFEPLLEINPDCVGWLTAPGVSTPVVQRDNDHYLSHDFYGEESRHGAVFASEYNTLRPPDDNIILYGHNMRDGLLFHPLIDYRELEFFEANPILSFDTLWEEGDYVVVAVFLANTRPEHGEIFAYHTMRQFSTAAEKENFWEEVEKRSLILTDTDCGAEDLFLTLSTCAYEFQDERVVVVARRLREGETAREIEARRVWENPDPLMPEIWVELYG